MITWILIICLMASLLAMLWFFVSANDRKRDFHWIRDKQEKLSQEYKELQWKHESLIHALKTARLVEHVEFSTHSEKQANTTNINTFWQEWDMPTEKYLVVTLRTTFGTRKFQVREKISEYSYWPDSHIAGGS